MTIEAITNWIVLTGIVVVFVVIAGGAAVAQPPQGRQTGTVLWFESLSGWRLGVVAAISWLALAALTIFLWIPIPIPLSDTTKAVARLAGLALFMAGVALVLWGRVTLGPLWTVTTGLGVRLHVGHRLIRHGPYAIVRHPMYLGYWLLVAGALVIYRTWVLAGYLAVIVPRFLGRARAEEVALAAAFGPDWSDYARHVPMWIPWLPR